MSGSNDPTLRLRIWQGGQFTASVESAADDRYTLIAGDGRGAVRTVAVDGAVWRETATTTATRPAGLAVRQLQIAVDPAGTVRRVEKVSYPGGVQRSVETLTDGLLTTRRSVVAWPDGSSTDQLETADGVSVRVDNGAGLILAGAVESSVDASVVTTTLDDGSRTVVTQQDTTTITERYAADGDLTSRNVRGEVDVNGGTMSHSVTEWFDSGGAVTDRIESVQNKYEGGAWNATLWSEDADGTRNTTTLEGHGDGSSYTREVVHPDGSTDDSRGFTSSSGGRNTTVEEFSHNDQLTERRATVSDTNGNELSRTSTEFKADGGAVTTTTTQQPDGPPLTRTTEVDSKGNPIEPPTPPDPDSSHLPPADDGWGDGSELDEPWRMLADDELKVLFGNVGAAGGRDDLATKVAGVRGQLAEVVTTGTGWSDVAVDSSTTVLELRLDAPSAVAVNARLKDLADPAAAFAFVRDLASAASGLASAAIDLPS
jgi:hypothetical protein